MDPFQLTEEAAADLDSICTHLLERAGLDNADRVITELFKSFYKLAEIPNVGHRRADLTSRDCLFYKVFSYLIVYMPASEPLQILAVLHGKRDVALLLRNR